MSSLLSNPAMIQAVVSSIGQSPLDVDVESGQANIKGSETDPYVTAAQFWMVELLGLAGLIAGLISFFLLFNFSLFVAVASVIVVALSLLVGYQKTKLRSLDGVRGQNMQLRSKVHQFHDENIRLGASVDEITKQSLKLQAVEKELDDISKRSGKSVDRLVEIVDENGKVQKEIVEKLEAEVMMQLMTAVLQTDLNRDFQLSPDEVNILVIRLASIPGIAFDESAFRKTLSTDEGDLTLADVCAIARNLHDVEQQIIHPENSNEKPASPIFEFRPVELLKKEE